MQEYHTNLRFPRFPRLQNSTSVVSPATSREFLLEVLSCVWLVLRLLALPSHCCYRWSASANSMVVLTPPPRQAPPPLLNTLAVWYATQGGCHVLEAFLDGAQTVFHLPQNSRGVRWVVFTVWQAYARRTSCAGRKIQEATRKAFLENFREFHS